MGRLTGQTALVTGAGSGIGKAIAERLAADGALVAVHYNKAESAAAEVVDGITEAGGTAFAVHAELGIPGDVDTLLAALDKGLRDHKSGTDLHILVNNAAAQAPYTIDEIDERDFDRVFAVNVKAPFFLIKRALSRLVDGGRIINISSGVTRVAFPEGIAYSMTKGAIDILGLALAKSLGARGITVNTVAPGLVETTGNTVLQGGPEAWAFAKEVSALGRIGQPADIADVVAFLACDDARWVSGHLLDVSGGSRL
nr:SDR family oxidoreductase [Kibdelosporangium sp. MJ126-NF4]CEL18245.1 3-oxoacyl-[acyl-carrier protein] reductase [Kibdelosporangium sp. MJ126-NF4]CTQ90525.1 3-oxoacyl-[acyl-carrier protein] reductase (EC 1.1.1.100) [Kibdelosporangium sp. MJ126-NF4]